MLRGSGDLAAPPDDVTGSVGTCWSLEAALAFFLASPLSTGDNALPRSHSSWLNWVHMNEDHRMLPQKKKKKSEAGNQNGSFLKG